MHLHTRWMTLVFVIGGSPLSFAQQAKSPPVHELVVATRHVPPFAIQGEDGEWSGIAIDLLRELGPELRQDSAEPIKWVFRDMTLKEMLAAVENGDVDLASAAITVNFERENAMDFSHPFHTSGLGIAVVSEKRNGLRNVLAGLFSKTLLLAGAVLIGLLLLSGMCIYFVERRRNLEQFGGGFWRGLGAGVWWSIVTATTVGYGDKSPRTGAGRAIAVVWMLSGILVISTFTAAVTSALTVGQLTGRIRGPNDLSRVRVATVADSTSQSYLRSRGVRHTSYSEIADALAALDDGEVGAVVYDSPLLRYKVFHDHPRLHVLPVTFEQQDYAIAMPSNSPWREQINRGVLRVISKPSWDEQLAKYIGER